MSKKKAIKKIINDGINRFEEDKINFEEEEDDIDFEEEYLKFLEFNDREDDKMSDREDRAREKREKDGVKYWKSYFSKILLYEDFMDVPIYSLLTHGNREFKLYRDEVESVDRIDYYTINRSNLTILTVNVPNKLLWEQDVNFLCYGYKNYPTMIKKYIIDLVFSNKNLVKKRRDLETYWITNSLLYGFRDFTKTEFEDKELFIRTLNLLNSNLNVNDNPDNIFEILRNNFLKDDASNDETKGVVILKWLENVDIENTFNISFRIYRPGDEIPHYKFSLNALNNSRKITGGSDNIVIPKGGVRHLIRFSNKPYFSNRKNNILENSFEGSIPFPSIFKYSDAIEDETIAEENYNKIPSFDSNIFKRELLDDNLDNFENDPSNRYENRIEQNDMLDFDSRDLIPELSDNLLPGVMVIFSCGGVKGIDMDDKTSSKQYIRLLRSRSDTIQNRDYYEKKYLKYKKKYLSLKNNNIN